MLYICDVLIQKNTDSHINKNKYVGDSEPIYFH